MRRVVPVLAISLVACVARAPVDPFGCAGGDADRDGLCDGEDPCPEDATDDADGDGVCAPEDTCPEGNDAEDADGDLVPDGCDLCPGAEDVDGDGDGQCDTTDPCPGDATNACAETVWIGVQADLFWEDIGWTLRSEDDAVLALGNMRSAGDGYFQAVGVDGNTRPCLQVDDSFGDGGSRGVVFNLERQLLLAEWEGSDYLGSQQLCFSPTVGVGYVPPKENVWLNSGQCLVEVRITTGLFPEELGWRLESYEGRPVEEKPFRSYTRAGANELTPITLTNGDYRFVQLDSKGDGWVGREDTATYRVLRVADQEELASGTLRGGSEGSITFVLDCP